MGQALRAGSSVSHYRVVSAIGAGGMGEVYKAVDDSLERPVALKVLPPELVKNDDRVRRFVQEAKSASGLSHPHIVTIYEIGKAEVTSDDNVSQDVHFIAMELVDGRTLKREIHEEHTDLRIIIGHLAQAADALAKAHAAGIVHRDLKPENIMISRDGYAKVLDFGLAKLTERRPDPGESNVRTAVREHTREGVVLGTVGYMSPEQVQGKQVDHRADIFSFGCILYEAATRKQPFEADSDVDVMHKILHDKPQPIDELNPSVPAELRRIIRRCLTKDPDKRYHSMKDLAIELADIAQEWDELSPASSSASSVSGATATLPGKRSLSTWLIVGGAVTIAVAAVIFGLLQMRNRREKDSGSAFSNMEIRRLTATGDIEMAMISPDGKYVVHAVRRAGKDSVRVRQVATGSDVEVVPPGLEINGVSFSPDGNYIYYLQLDQEPSAYNILYQVPTLGGNPRKILFDVDTEPSFSPDGKRFTFIRGIPDENASAVMVANADGSGAKQLATAKAPDRFPNDAAVWSPDGSAIAAVRKTAGASGRELVAIIDAATGAASSLGTVSFADINRLVWLSDGSGVLCVATNHESLLNHQIWLISYPAGEARKITNDLSDYQDVSVTADGRSIAATQISETSNLWIVPPNGSPRQVTSGGGLKVYDLHVGEKNIYFTGFEENRSNVWIANRDGSNPRPLIADSETNWGPATPLDESFVAFVSLRDGETPRLWRVDADGSNPRLVVDDPLVGQRPSVSPDGRFILYRSVKATFLKRVPAGGGTPVVITDRLRGGGGYSRDGRYIGMALYDRTEGGRIQTRLAIVPAEGGNPVMTFEQQSWEYGYGPDPNSFSFILKKDGVSNLWRHPFDGSPPTQITNFTDGRISAFDFGSDGTLYLGRGEVTRDVVLISNFR
jgi:serine/threonine protein kinase/Tol biopolymer transport system component